MKKLFWIYLWWKFKNKFIEEHDIVFVVASDKEEAKELAKLKTNITEELHCDWIICIENIDWYWVNLEHNNNKDKIEFDSTYSEIN